MKQESDGYADGRRSSHKGGAGGPPGTDVGSVGRHTGADQAHPVGRTVQTALPFFSRDRGCLDQREWVNRSSRRAAAGGRVYAVTKTEKRGRRWRRKSLRDLGWEENGNGRAPGAERLARKTRQRNGRIKAERAAVTGGLLERHGGWTACCVVGRLGSCLEGSWIRG